MKMLSMLSIIAAKPDCSVLVIIVHSARTIEYNTNNICDVQVYNVAILESSEDHCIPSVISGNTKLLHGSGFQRIKLVFFNVFLVYSCYEKI